MTRIPILLKIIKDDDCSTTNLLWTVHGSQEEALDERWGSHFIDSIIARLIWEDW
jgi:hypothetical protein